MRRLRGGAIGTAAAAAAEEPSPFGSPSVFGSGSWSRRGRWLRSGLWSWGSAANDRPEPECCESLRMRRDCTTGGHRVYNHRTSPPPLRSSVVSARSWVKDSGSAVREGQLCRSSLVSARSWPKDYMYPFFFSVVSMSCTRGNETIENPCHVLLPVPRPSQRLRLKFAFWSRRLVGRR